MTSLAKCFGWSQICWSGERVQNYIVFFLWLVELNAKNTHILDHIILQWLAVCLAQMPLSTSLPLSQKEQGKNIEKYSPSSRSCSFQKAKNLIISIFYVTAICFDFTVMLRIYENTMRRNYSERTTFTSN